MAYRLKKLATQGTLTHGNTGKSNRPFSPDRQEILRMALLREREGISVPKETLRRWLKRPHKYRPKKNGCAANVLLVSEIYSKSTVLSMSGSDRKERV